MFHLNVKPRPPSLTGVVTPGHAVDSSATVMQPGASAMHRLVELLEELDRLEILASAVAVAQPLARLAAVVEVEHRRDGVDAQAVDVEFVEPVQRVGDEEIPHLVAAVVEDQRAPVGMLAEPRILVLVQRGAVEATQREVVFRKVRRHPVENDADAVLVQRIDERSGNRRAFRSATSARSSR